MSDPAINSDSSLENSGAIAGDRNDVHSVTLQSEMQDTHTGVGSELGGSNPLVTAENTIEGPIDEHATPAESASRQDPCAPVVDDSHTHSPSDQPAEENCGNVHAIADEPATDAPSSAIADNGDASCGNFEGNLPLTKEADSSRQHDTGDHASIQETAMPDTNSSSVSSTVDMDGNAAIAVPASTVVHEDDSSASEAPVGTGGREELANEDTKESTNDVTADVSAVTSQRDEVIADATSPDDDAVSKSAASGTELSTHLEHVDGHVAADTATKSTEDTIPVISSLVIAEPSSTVVDSAPSQDDGVVESAVADGSTDQSQMADAPLGVSQDSSDQAHVAGGVVPEEVAGVSVLEGVVEPQPVITSTETESSGEGETVVTEAGAPTVSVAASTHEEQPPTVPAESGTISDASSASVPEADSSAGAGDHPVAGDEHPQAALAAVTEGEAAVQADSSSVEVHGQPVAADVNSASDAQLNAAREAHVEQEDVVDPTLVLIFGTSGAGKSSLISSILSLLPDMQSRLPPSDSSVLMPIAEIAFPLEGSSDFSQQKLPRGKRAVFIMDATVANNPSNTKEQFNFLRKRVDLGIERWLVLLNKIDAVDSIDADLVAQAQTYLGLTPADGSNTEIVPISVTKGVNLSFVTHRLLVQTVEFSHQHAGDNYVSNESAAAKATSVCFFPSSSAVGITTAYPVENFNFDVGILCIDMAKSFDEGLVDAYSLHSQAQLASPDALFVIVGLNKGAATALTLSQLRRLACKVQARALLPVDVSLGTYVKLVDSTVAAVLGHSDLNHLLNVCAWPGNVVDLVRRTKGVVFKKGGLFGAQWQKRYFIIDEAEARIRNYKEEGNEKSERNTLSLQGVKARKGEKDEPDKKRFTFVMENAEGKGRDYHLYVESPEERDMWVDTIRDFATLA